MMDSARKTQIERWGVAGLLLVLVVVLAPALRSLGIGARRAARMTTPLIEPSSQPVSVLEAIRRSPERMDAQVDQAVAGPALPRGPVIQYTAQALRDPLVSLLPAEPPQDATGGPPSSGTWTEDPLSSPPSLPVFTVQGTIWGGVRPQALIDRKVYEVGDTVEGARILAIDWNGVTVDVRGTTFHLTTNPTGMHPSHMGGER